MDKKKLQPKIVIHMLGPLEVFRDGVKMTPKDFGSRKARMLLRWLADARNTAVPQDLLLEAFWPAVAHDKSLKSFRVRMSELRRLLSPIEKSNSPLERLETSYILRTIPGRLETDVDQFVALASKGMQMDLGPAALPYLEQSLALYKGEYFSDDPYTEHWYSARERYRKIFVATASRLATIYESLARYEDGIHLLQPLLKLADFDEELYRALMRLHYLNGDQTAALQTFEECRRFLHTELGTQPLPQTLRLFRQMLRHEPLDENPPTAVQRTPHVIPHQRGADLETKWPFLGRFAESTHIQRKIAEMKKGEGGIIWLCGPSGIGKTRLLKEILAAPTEDGQVRTMWIQGSYLDSHIPFAAILDGLQIGMKPGLTPEQTETLMNSASPQLRQLTGWSSDPIKKSIDSNEPPSAPMNEVMLRQEVLRLFERLTETMPLICCFDDVHTLDSASRTLLLSLARRTHNQSLLIVATSRRMPQQDDLGSDILRLDTPPDVISLEPLPVSALRPLVGRGIPTLWTQNLLRQLHEETSGEPLMLVEKLNSLKEENLIDFVDGEVVFPSGLLNLITPPSSMDLAEKPLQEKLDKFQQQWDKLDDDQQSLLQKAAALRSSLTLQRLERLSTKPRVSFHRALEHLIRQGYFTMSPSPADATSGISFAHSRLRHRTYQMIPPSERIWYHRRIFELLKAEAEEGNHHDPITRARTLSATAFHALLAGEWEACARWSLQAADSAKSIMPGPEVVALCKQAFHAVQRIETLKDSSLLEETHFALGDALFDVGSYEEALKHYEVLADTSNRDPILVTRRLTMIYLRLNYTEKARALADQVLIDAGDNPKALSRANLNKANVHYQSGEPAESIQRSYQCIDHLQDDPDPFTEATANHQLALSYWDLGEYGHALEHARKSVDLRRSLEVTQLINSLNMLGELYQDLFCTKLARKVHREALDLAISHGRVVFSIEIWRNLGLSYIYDGRVEKGLNILKRAWQDVQDLNLVPYWHEVHLRSLLEAKLLAHRPDKVKVLLEQYKKVLGPRESPFVIIFSLAFAFMEGRIDEGEAMLSQVQTFWHQTGRRARAAHIYLFVGQELMLHGHSERAHHYLMLATKELDRICQIVPEDIAEQIRASRQYNAPRHLTQSPTFPLRNRISYG